MANGLALRVAHADGCSRSRSSGLSLSAGLSLSEYTLHDHFGRRGMDSDRARSRRRGRRASRTGLGTDARAESARTPAGRYASCVRQAVVSAWRAQVREWRGADSTCESRVSGRPYCPTTSRCGVISRGLTSQGRSSEGVISEGRTSGWRARPSRWRVALSRREPLALEFALCWRDYHAALSFSQEARSGVALDSGIADAGAELVRVCGVGVGVLRPVGSGHASGSSSFSRGEIREPGMREDVCSSRDRAAHRMYGAVPGVTGLSGEVLEGPPSCARPAGAFRQEPCSARRLDRGGTAAA